MRLIVLKPDNLQVLRAQLATASSSGSNASIDRLKALNPHIDFNRLDTGAVIFLPDAPDLAQPGSRAVDGDSFDEFTADVVEGLKLATARTRSGYEQLGADRSDVAAAVKTAAVKRLIESDPALKAQLDEVNAQSAKDQRDAKESGAALDAMQKNVAQEMTALGKLFT